MTTYSAEAPPKVDVADLEAAGEQSAGPVVSRRKLILGSAAALFLASCGSGPEQEIGVALKDSLFGVAINGSFQPMPAWEIGRRLDLVKGLHANAIRVDYDSNFDSLYGTGQSDRIMRAAAQRGLNVLATISYVPPNERLRACAGNYLCRPYDVSTSGPFVDFAGSVVAKSIDFGVHTYEIWNEPNISPGGADPEAYAKMFKAVRNAIKKVDPQAKVIIGGLAPDASGEGSMLPADFLAALYDAGLGGFFDGVAIHPYATPALPNQPAPWNGMTQVDGPGLSGQDTLFGVLAAHGDAGLPIRLTEMGAPTDGGGVEVTTATQKQYFLGWPQNSFFDEQLQAETIAQGLTHQFPDANVTGRYVFTLADSTASGDPNSQYYYGLYYSNSIGQPVSPKRLAVNAFRQAVASS